MLYCIFLAICVGITAGIQNNKVCEDKESGEKLPIENDCQHYWSCLEGISYKISCKQNMEFSPTKRQCVKKALSDCNLKVSNDPLKQACENQRFGTLVPHPETCTKFLVCDYIHPTVQDCPKGLHFNNKLKVCDWPNHAGCEEPETITTTLATTTITTSSTTTEDDFCANELEGSRHPYLANCSIYIRCESGFSNIYSCPSDKLFNPSLLICDTPEAFECSSEFVPNTSTEKPPLFYSNICDNELTGTKVSYPENCKKYIACDLPAPIVYFCCDDLDFNAELQICEDPEKAGCGAIHTTTESITTTEGTTVAPNKGVCYNKQEGSFVSYPDNCLKYITCSKPIPTAAYCPNNLFFNENLQICDIPEDSGCKDEGGVVTTSPVPQTTTMIPTTPEYSNVCCNEEINSKLPYPGDCSKYIICENPIPKVMECPIGQHFNAATKKCDTIENANCIDNPTETTISSTDPTETTISSTESSTYTTTDQTISTTDTTDSSMMTSTDLTTQSTEDTSTQDITSTEQNTEDTSTTTTDPSNECAGKPDGTKLPYIGDCAMYILCDDGFPRILPCTEGLLFNPKTSQCDIPKEVGCPNKLHNMNPLSKCFNQITGTRLKHKDDCTSYILCYGDLDITTSCPNNYVFNPNNERCVSSEEYVCPMIE